MEIEILGKKRSLVLTIGAVKTYCQVTNTSFIDFAASMQKIDVEQVEVLIFSALLGACKRDKVELDFTVDDIKDEMDSWPLSRMKLLLEVFTALISEASVKNV